MEFPSVRDAGILGLCPANAGVGIFYLMRPVHAHAQAQTSDLLPPSARLAGFGSSLFPGCIPGADDYKPPE